MEELQKVKRSWTEERQELHAEAEALRRQALKLQSEQATGSISGRIRVEFEAQGHCSGGSTLTWSPLHRCHGSGSLRHKPGFVPSIRSDGYNPQAEKSFDSLTHPRCPGKSRYDLNLARF